MGKLLNQDLNYVGLINENITVFEVFFCKYCGYFDILLDECKI